MKKGITKNKAKEKFIEYALEHNVDKTVVMTVAGATKLKIDYNALSMKGDVNMCTLFDEIIPGGEEQYIKVMKEVIENQEQGEKLCTCGSVSYQILIDSEGYVYPCGGLAEEDFKIGNILVDDISDLVKYHSGKYYGEIISKMLSNEKFSKCRNCIVREFCWTCLSEVLSKSMYNEVFEAFCDMNYKKWNKIVWENKGKK